MCWIAFALTNIVIFEIAKIIKTKHNYEQAVDSVEQATLEEAGQSIHEEEWIQRWHNDGRILVA